MERSPFYRFIGSNRSNYATSHHVFPSGQKVPEQVFNDPPSNLFKQGRDELSYISLKPKLIHPMVSYYFS